MTYLQDKKIKRRKIIAVAVGSILLLATIGGLASVINFFRPLSNKLVTSIFNAKTMAGTETKSILETKNSLRAIIAQQEIVLNDYKIKETMQISERLELETLRQMVGVMSTLPKSTGAVRRSAVSAYGTFLITSNSNAIGAGDIVVAKDGYYVGQVIEVTGKEATVLLAEKNKEPINVTLPQSEITIAARGNTRGVLVATIPRDTTVEIGESVILSAEPNIPVGLVVALSNDEKNPLKEIYIRLGARVENDSLFLTIKK